MRCPFLLLKEKKKVPIYDDLGYKIEDKEEEAWNVSPCIEKECEIYDEENGKCSILSIVEVIKTTTPELIAKKIDKSLFERAEMLSVVLSSGLQHMEETAKQTSAQIANSMNDFSTILKEIVDILHSIKTKIEGKEEEEKFYS